jgi:hypothetical protein
MWVVSATTTGVCDVFLLFFCLVSLFSYSGRLDARQQVLATSIRLVNRALLGAGHSCSPGRLLAKFGSGELNHTKK